jgi:hypothetical protein
LPSLVDQSNVAMSCELVAPFSAAGGGAGLLEAVRGALWKPFARRSDLI